MPRGNHPYNPQEGHVPQTASSESLYEAMRETVTGTVIAKIDKRPEQNSGDFDKSQMISAEDSAKLEKLVSASDKKPKKLKLVHYDGVYRLSQQVLPISIGETSYGDFQKSVRRQWVRITLTKVDTEAKLLNLQRAEDEMADDEKDVNLAQTLSNTVHDSQMMMNHITKFIEKVRNGVELFRMTMPTEEAVRHAYDRYRAAHPVQAN